MPCTVRDYDFRSLSRILLNHLVFTACASSESSGSRVVNASHFLYTTGIHVVVVRIYFSHNVCALVLQHHVPLSLSGSIAVIHRQKFKTIITINHERMNTAPPFHFQVQEWAGYTFCYLAGEVTDKYKQLIVCCCPQGRILNFNWLPSISSGVEGVHMFYYTASRRNKQHALTLEGSPACFACQPEPHCQTWYSAGLIAYQGLLPSLI